MEAQPENLVPEAEAAYSGVVRDPARYAARIPKLIARARTAGDTEALVVALRAQAWAQHVVLDNQAAVIHRLALLAPITALPSNGEILLRRDPAAKP